MYQIIGQGDPSNILNIIINKLSTNLKCWPDDYNIINQSLLLLQNLVVTYTTSKLLLKVPALDFLLQHHNVWSRISLSTLLVGSLRLSEFPVLQSPENALL